MLHYISIHQNRKGAGKEEHFFKVQLIDHVKLLFYYCGFKAFCKQTFVCMSMADEYYGLVVDEFFNTIEIQNVIFHTSIPKTIG